MSFKRGFSEADQEALANSSHGAREHRERFPRSVPACGVCVCVHARACASASFRVRRPCTTVGAGRRESSLGKRTREAPLVPRVCTPRFSAQRGSDPRTRAPGLSRTERKSFRRGGLGYSGDGDGGGGGGGGHKVGAPGGAHHNIQASAAAHYNNRQDSHRTLNTRSDTLQQKNLNNWVKATLIASAVRPMYSILDLACGKGGRQTCVCSVRTCACLCIRMNNVQGVCVCIRMKYMQGAYAPCVRVRAFAYVSNTCSVCVYVYIHICMYVCIYLYTHAGGDRCAAAVRLPMVAAEIEPLNRRRCFDQRPPATPPPAQRRRSRAVGWVDMLLFPQPKPRALPSGTR